ncbi:unnamed protein product, partial [Scytosiphon promiscuus]
MDSSATSMAAVRGRRGWAAHEDGGLVGSRQRQHSPPHQYRRTSGSGGVFCPTWDWGRAACEPTIRLPGSFVDRRFEEVDEQRRRRPPLGRNPGKPRCVSVCLREGRGVSEVFRSFSGRRLAPSRAGTHAGRKCFCALGLHKKDLAHLPRSPKKIPPPTSHVTQAPASPATEKPRALRPRDGIGALFTQLCYPSEDDGGGSRICDTNASGSVFLATVTNSGDGGLREMSVFCAGPAGRAPDAAPPSLLARQVSLFLQSEEAVAEDLKVYAEALDPAAVDVVAGLAKPADHHQQLSTDSAKLLRVFCRYAACRLGRALEVASCAAAAADTESSAG